MAGPGPSGRTSLGGERVLVTGAGGFIGSRLLERLRGDGVEIHAVSRTHDPGEEDGIRWWRADLVDGGAVRKLVTSVRPDVIVNLAGESRAARGPEFVRPTFDTNLAGTVNLLLAAEAAGCRRLLLTGSLEEPGPESGPTASSPYAASKWASSTYGRMFHELYGVPVVLLRVFMVFGPGQRDLRKLVPYTILKLLRGEAPELSSGRREIDWVYVDDVADAFVAAARADERINGETFDIGSGRLCSVREIVERLTQLVAPGIQPVFGAVEDRPLEQVRAAATAAGSAQLGWRAATSLDEGLRQTVAWYERAVDEGIVVPGDLSDDWLA